MNVTCNSCSASYDIDTAKIPPAGGFFKCRKCGQPVPLIKPPEQPIPLASAQDDVLEVVDADPLEEEAATLAPFPAPGAPIALPSSVDAPAASRAPHPRGGGPTTEPPRPPPPHPATAPQSARIPPPSVTVAPAVPSSAVPRFLEDLPAAVPTPALAATLTAADDSHLFDDLPAPSPSVAAAPRAETAAANDAALFDDDLPTNIAEETPFAATPGLSLELEDVPSDEHPPSLMDELGLEHTTQPSFDLGLAPAAVAPAPPGSPSTLRLGDELEPEGKEIVAPSKSRRLTLVLVGVAAVVVLGAGAAVVAWRMGLLSARPSGTLAPVATVTPKPIAAAAPRLVEPLEPSPATPPKPASKAPPVLTLATADTLGYDALLTTTKAWREEGQENAPAQVLWALYRLADTFGDVTARERLAALVPKRPTSPDLDDTTVAAAFGSQLLATKKPAVRKAAERTLRTRFPASARLTYVLARSFNPKRRPELARALKMLEPQPGSTLTPTLDAWVLRAELLLADKKVDEAVAHLSEAAKQQPDDPLRMRAALLLASTGHIGPLGALVPEGALGDLDELAPSQRATYLALAVRRAIVGGDMQAALTLARRRLEVTPESAAAALELVRLTRAAGEDATAVVAKVAAQLNDPQARAQLAAAEVQSALQRGDLDTAKATLEAARADTPGASSSWLKLAEGRIAQAQGQVPRARTAYTIASQGRPKLVDARLALVLLAPSKPAQLVTRLLPLAKQAPDAALVSYELARAYAQIGSFQTAAEQYGRTLWRDPTVADPIDLVLAWVAALAESGEAERVAAMLTDLEEHRPRDVRFWRTQASLATRRKDFERAVTAYRRLAQIEPPSLDDRVALAAVLNDAGNFIDAQGELDQLVKENAANSTPPVLLQLGRAWLVRDEVKARTHYLDSLRQQPSPLGFRLLGELEEKRGKMDEALDAYRKAIDLDASLMDVRLHVAATLMQKGEYERAGAEAKAILVRNPKDLPAALLYGDALREQGKLREAIVAYQGALKVGGSSPDVLMKLARAMLLQQDRLPQAVKLLRQVTKVAPTRGEAYYYLGYAQKDLGELGEAKASLQEYLRLEPSGEFAGDVRREIDALQ